MTPLGRKRLVLSPVAQYMAIHFLVTLVFEYFGHFDENFETL